MSVRGLYVYLSRTNSALSPWFMPLLWRVGISLVLLLVTFSLPSWSRSISHEKVRAMSSMPMVMHGTQKTSVPILAYYYIWFDVQSWERAKVDYPLLGPYSSDDANVMRQHIRWAKEAGIDGFLVSWKGTDKLNRRLAQLVEIAEQEDFKLAINYESLNFERVPLSVDQVDADFSYFTDHYVNHRVFRIFDKPLVIWSGTWEFSVDEIQSVLQSQRERILILASEKNVKDYQRLAALTDGNAYYWSSVNPDTHPGYAEKLIAMGEAVHANGGLWVAPAAPGFDSRLLGGETVIDRKDGETLQIEINTALQSKPDVVGIISWNEFSENTHIEPSDLYGKRFLEVLAEDCLCVTPKR